MIPDIDVDYLSHIYIASTAIVQESAFSKIMALNHFLYDCIFTVAGIGILNKIVLKRNMLRIEGEEKYDTLRSAEPVTDAFEAGEEAKGLVLNGSIATISSNNLAEGTHSGKVPQAIGSTILMSPLALVKPVYEYRVPSKLDYYVQHLQKRLPIFPNSIGFFGYGNNNTEPQDIETFTNDETNEGSDTSLLPPNESTLHFLEEHVSHLSDEIGSLLIGREVHDGTQVETLDIEALKDDVNAHSKGINGVSNSDGIMSDTFRETLHEVNQEETKAIMFLQEEKPDDDEETMQDFNQDEATEEEIKAMLHAQENNEEMAEATEEETKAMLHAEENNEEMVDTASNEGNGLSSTDEMPPLVPDEEDYFTSEPLRNEEMPSQATDDAESVEFVSPDSEFEGPELTTDAELDHTINEDADESTPETINPDKTLAIPGGGLDNDQLANSIETQAPPLIKQNELTMSEEETNDNLEESTEIEESGKKANDNLEEPTEIEEAGSIPHSTMHETDASTVAPNFASTSDMAQGLAEAAFHAEIQRKSDDNTIVSKDQIESDMTMVREYAKRKRFMQEVSQAKGDSTSLSDLLHRMAQKDTPSPTYSGIEDVYNQYSGIEDVYNQEKENSDPAEDHGGGDFDPAEDLGGGEDFKMAQGLADAAFHAELQRKSAKEKKTGSVLDRDQIERDMALVREEYAKRKQAREISEAHVDSTSTSALLQRLAEKERQRKFDSIGLIDPRLIDRSNEAKEEASSFESVEEEYEDEDEYEDVEDTTDIDLEATYEEEEDLDREDDLETPPVPIKLNAMFAKNKNNKDEECDAIAKVPEKQGSAFSLATKPPVILAALALVLGRRLLHIWVGRGFL